MMGSNGQSHAAFAAMLLAGCAATAPVQPTLSSKRYEDLAAFFAAWRAFQRPKLVDGVPDYSASSMAAQHRELARWQRRLDPFDTTGWRAGQKADPEILPPGTNGLAF